MRTTKVTAAALTVLGWGVLKFKSGYEIAGQLPTVYNSLRHGLNYLIMCYDSTTTLLRVKVCLNIVELFYVFERLYFHGDMQISLQFLLNWDMGYTVCQKMMEACNLIFTLKSFMFTPCLVFVESFMRLCERVKTC